MAISQLVLGMNARNFLFVRAFNRRKYKLIADDKLETKRRLISDGVATTELLAEFRSFQDVRAFDWSSLPESFVLKPAHGYGGRGIVVVGKWNGNEGIDTKNNPITKIELEGEIFGTLDGAHSLNNLPDDALIEERVEVHNIFKKYTAGGVPDIRVIVCDKIPIMAMLRLPTVHSDGKANLHLGAVGVGIDMRTGITTFGVFHGHLVKTIPGTRTKVHGIKIPDWYTILEVATKAQMSSGLGFVGIDIVLDQEKGPLVLEINARPGLGIQIANQASLRTRLERVANLDINDVGEAVDLAQKLFAKKDLNDAKAADKVLGVVEKVIINGKDKRKTILAKIDTGAYRTSIDSALVEELELKKLPGTVRISSGTGETRRPTTEIEFSLREKNIKSVASYVDRSHMRYQMIVGRKDLAGFYVDPADVASDVD